MEASSLPLLLLALSMMFLVFVLKFSLQKIVAGYLYSFNLSMAALLIMTDGGSGLSP